MAPHVPATGDQVQQSQQVLLHQDIIIMELSSTLDQGQNGGSGDGDGEDGDGKDSDSEGQDSSGQDSSGQDAETSFPNFNFTKVKAIIFEHLETFFKPKLAEVVCTDICSQHLMLIP